MEKGREFAFTPVWRSARLEILTATMKSMLEVFWVVRF
jgi:hypothetical protein